MRVKHHRQSCDRHIAITHKCLCYVNNPLPDSQFFLGKDNLFGKVQQMHRAILVTGQQMIVNL